MTPTEWGRLQGFIGYAFVNKETGIDEFSFPDNTAIAQQYKQFGNSVTIPVIEELALFMLGCFEKMTSYQLKFVLKLIEDKDYVTKKDVMESLNITSSQADYLLKKLVRGEKLKQKVFHKKTKYVLA